MAWNLTSIRCLILFETNRKTMTPVNVCRSWVVDLFTGS